MQNIHSKNLFIQKKMKIIHSKKIFIQVKNGLSPRATLVQRTQVEQPFQTDMAIGQGADLFNAFA